MKTATKYLGTALIIGLLVLSANQLLCTDAIANSNMQAEASGSSIYLGSKPLTNSEISSQWPNLPNAKQLMTADIYIFRDSRDYSDQQYFNSTIANCTSDGINSYLGGVTHNIPNIWLQYNDTIWVEVPQTYFAATQNLSTGRSPNRENLVSPMITTPTSTWALGLYADPSNVSGSNSVSGTASFGEWQSGWNSGNTGDYVISPIVSVMPQGTTYMLQEFMCEVDNNSYHYIGQNVIDLSTDPPTYYRQIAYLAPSAAASNTLYNLYVKNNSTDHMDWDLCWNWTTDVCHVGFSVAHPYITTGNQPSVEFETSETTSTHFISGYVSNIGGNYTYGGQTYYEAAVGYLFGGNWVPQYSTDHVPYAKVYYGYTTPPSPNGGFIVGGPLTNPSWMGVNSPYVEQMQVGRSISLPAQNSVLWNYK
jgi:hypothetical protein